MNVRNVLLVCLSVGLTACGGGSSDPETSTPTPSNTKSAEGSLVIPSSNQVASQQAVGEVNNQIRALAAMC